MPTQGTTAPPAPTSLAQIAIVLVGGLANPANRSLICQALAGPVFANAIAIANEVSAPFLLRAPPPEIIPDSALQGCFCCRKGAFASVLEALVRAVDNHRMPPFDRLLIECAPDADPALLAGELLHHPYLSRRFRLDLIAFTANEGHVGGSARRQAEMADIMVLPENASPELARFALSVSGKHRLLEFQEYMRAPDQHLSRRAFDAQRYGETIRRRIYGLKFPK